jgi:hypothetical protein
MDDPVTDSNWEERLFQWIIIFFLGVAFLAILISTFYPLVSRRVWIDVIEGVGAAIAFVFDTFPVGAIIGYGSLVLFALLGLTLIWNVLNTLWEIFT